MSAIEHPVSASADLESLRSLLRGAAGPVVSARPTYGGEVELAFGPSSRDLFGAERPAWLLGTQASPWRLTDAGGEAILSSVHEEGPQRLAELVRSRVVRSVDLRQDGFDLGITFDDGSAFFLEAKTDLDAIASPFPEPPYWELFTPRQTVVAVGPGPGWIEYPVDLPEKQVPLPGFPAMTDPRVRAVVMLNRDLSLRLAETSREIERSQRRFAYLSAAVGLLSAVVIVAALLNGDHASSSTILAVIGGLVGGAATMLAASSIRLADRVRHTAEPNARTRANSPGSEGRVPN